MRGTQAHLTVQGKREEFVGRERQQRYIFHADKDLSSKCKTKCHFSENRVAFRNRYEHKIGNKMLNFSSCC